MHSEEQVSNPRHETHLFDSPKQHVPDREGQCCSMRMRPLLLISSTSGIQRYAADSSDVLLFDWFQPLHQAVRRLIVLCPLAQQSRIVTGHSSHFGKYDESKPSSECQYPSSQARLRLMDTDNTLANLSSMPVAGCWLSSVWSVFGRSPNAYVFHGPGQACFTL